MSGTTKAIVSMCVLLLAALVVYYGMTPPDRLSETSLDLPTHRTATIENAPFGGDAFDKAEGMGLLFARADQQDESTVSPAPIEKLAPIAVPVPAPEPVIEIQQPEQVVETSTFTLYTLLEGETLGEIATRELGSYNKWREIASLNNISDPSRIRPGTVLQLPIRTVQKPNVVASTISGQNMYTISEGDTLSSIAESFYGNANLFELIARANPSMNPDELSIGDRIKIPQR